MNMDALRMIGSLVVVFGLLGALLWGLKRLQLQTRPGQPGARRLQVLESHSVGPRQKNCLGARGCARGASGRLAWADHGFGSVVYGC